MGTIRTLLEKVGVAATVAAAEQAARHYIDGKVAEYKLKHQVVSEEDREQLAGKPENPLRAVAGNLKSKFAERFGLKKRAPAGSDNVVNSVLNEFDEEESSE